MIIERNFSRFIIFEEESLVAALDKINGNKKRIIFLVTESGQLTGAFTDGDLRRKITSGVPFELTSPIKRYANSKFVTLGDNSPTALIAKTLSERIEAIPLLDGHGRITGIAFSGTGEIWIGDRPIGNGHPTFIIAEIGNNHNGSVALAKRLVDAAVDAGADCAKFQTRTMSELYVGTSHSANQSEDLGVQYTRDLLDRFQLERSELQEVFAYCAEQGILPLCTPWDLASLSFLDELGMVAFKLASADLTNLEMIEAMARTGKPIIASTGMSTEAEIAETVKTLKKNHAQFVLLHCNSTYPAPFKDINLQYLDRLKEIGDCPVGYSGHERGVHIPLVAVGKGACVIEKHLTLDKQMEGNDHRVSLLPKEFSQMVSLLRETESALGSADPRTITQGEMINREVLGKSLVASRDLRAGERITRQMVKIKSPGKGLPPYCLNELVGTTAKRDLRKDEFFFYSDIRDEQEEARPYSFSRPFGIPVRYHDFQSLANKSNFDLVEFHLSYKDMEAIPGEFLSPRDDLGLVVHSPELFQGDHIMDLCASDLNYRERSIRELQRVVDITREISSSFSSRTPRVIINAGGFSMDNFLDESLRNDMHDLVADSLAKVNQTGVKILPQTMPPFPWHFGGQRFHNLFMHPQDIDRFCRLYDYKICIDVSHSQLACNHFHLSFNEFLSITAKHADHLHIADADGVDGEGLQIGEGRVDFGMVARNISQRAPDASFIPEIWQGHKNDGEGFWIALERLEEWFGQVAPE
jgi:sialic acid synthase SpsE/sugar phosphate isomerase/epimerase